MLVCKHITFLHCLKIFSLGVNERCKVSATYSSTFEKGCGERKHFQWIDSCMTPVGGEAPAKAHWTGIQVRAQKPSWEFLGSKSRLEPWPHISPLQRRPSPNGLRCSFVLLCIQRFSAGNERKGQISLISICLLLDFTLKQHWVISVRTGGAQKLSMFEGIYDLPSHSLLSSDYVGILCIVTSDYYFILWSYYSLRWLRC